MFCFVLVGLLFVLFGFGIGEVCVVWWYVCDELACGIVLGDVVWGCYCAADLVMVWCECPCVIALPS